MPDNGSLDTRIRDLVARAVADAPRPPELDPDALPDVDAELDHGHRRWWIGGGAALLAAAAAITTLLLVNGTDQAVRTPPATDPTIVVAPGPPPASAPDDQTSGTEVATRTPTRTFLTAGPEGVVFHRGGRARVLTTDAAAIALDTGDGQVILQDRRGEGSWSAADTEPLIISSTGSVRSLFDGFDWGGYVTLHDVEVVAGRRLLLYSVFEGDPPRPQTLYVVDLGTGTPEEVGATDVDPVNRLHLAATGLIVGTARNQLSHGIEIHAVPGSPAAEDDLPTAADLGFEDQYNDCSDCPSAFTVNSEGASIAWTEDGWVSVAFIGQPDSTIQVQPVPDGLIADVDYERGGILFSFDDADGPRVPVVARPDGRRAPELEGAMATFSPLGTSSAAPASVPTTTTSTTVPTTTTPTVDDPAAILTAGPAGVVDRRAGETRTLTTEPMVFALDAGDGRILVQRHAGIGDDWSDADTAPLVLAADGTLTELFGTADWDGGVVLHDVEVVAGRRLLLFSLRRPQVPQEPNEDLYVVDLATQDRTLVAESIGGWEFGTSRLHLATTGLIVGETSGEAIHEIEFLAVPGSPAAAAALPTAAALGLEDSYSDCNDCPYRFSVAPDGETVAWIDGATNQLMRVPVTGGTAEPIVEVPAEYFADLDYNDDGAVLSWPDFVSAGETPAPIEVPFDGSGPNELDGTLATLGPAGTDATEPPPSTAPADPEPICGVDPGAATITDHIGDVPPGSARFPGWVYGGESNFDPCAALSYARLDIQLATASSPVQVMLFHQGSYIGTATECAHAFITVTGTTKDSVEIEYRWPRGDDPNATPSGLATVTYRWAGDAVQTDGELPQELLDLTGCSG